MATRAIRRARPLNGRAGASDFGGMTARQMANQAPRGTSNATIRSTFREMRAAGVAVPATGA